MIVPIKGTGGCKSRFARLYRPVSRREVAACPGLMIRVCSFVSFAYCFAKLSNSSQRIPTISGFKSTYNGVNFIKVTLSDRPKLFCEGLYSSRWEKQE